MPVSESVFDDVTIAVHSTLLPNIIDTINIPENILGQSHVIIVNRSTVQEIYFAINNSAGDLPAPTPSVEGSNSYVIQSGERFMITQWGYTIKQIKLISATGASYSVMII